MDSFVAACARLLSNPNFQTLLKNLKKQNDLFDSDDNKKLLMDESERGEFEEEDHDDFDEENLEGITGNELALSVMERISKMFEYTSIYDLFLLFLGILCTFIHAGIFPLLAILFGNISNAYIQRTIRETKNMTSNSSHASGNETIGLGGKLALSLLTRVTSQVSPKFNASVIPTADQVSGGGYLGDLNLYKSNGTETMNDFATYVADFSTYYVYIGIAAFVTAFFQTLTWEWVAEIQLYRIKQKYIYQLQRQEMAWFSRRASGKLVLTIADDCERFREGVGQKFILVIECIIIAFYGAVIALLTNTKLALVFLGSTPFIATKLLVLGQKIAHKSSLAQKRFAKAGKISSEILSGMRTVASFGGERKEVGRYKAALLKGRAAADSKAMLTGVGIGGMYFLIFAFYAVALWYSVNLLAEGVVNPGQIYTVFLSLTLSAFALGSLLPYVNSIASAYASIKTLGHVLNSVPKIDPYSLRGELPRAFHGRITFSSVTFAYPGRKLNPIFNNLELDIPGEKITAIVGPGSCGKSTLVNLMLRFYDPQKGQVKFDKFNIRMLNVRWIRQQIAVVDQNPVLYDTTIFENIRSLRKDIDLKRVIEAAKMTSANKFIKKLPDKYDTRVKLAGGMDIPSCQRIQIFIAKYIISNPKILILDKALSALSPKIAEKIMKNLAECRKNATTIIMDNKVGVAQYADIIYVMKEGRVVEKGTHEKLSKNRGVYYRMLQQEDLVDEEDIPEEVIELKPITPIVEYGDVMLIAPQQSYHVAIQEVVGPPELCRENPPLSKVFGITPGGSTLLYFGIFGCILSGLVVPLLSLSLAQILDMFLGSKDELFVSGIFWVEVLIGFALLAGIGYCTRTVFIGQVGEGLSLHLRVATYESILRQPISWFDFEENAPGLLYAKLAADIPSVRNAVGHQLGTAVSALTTTLTGLIIATIYSWPLGLIASLTIPVSLSGFFVLRKVLKSSHIHVMTLQRKLLSMTYTVIKNIISIQAECIAFAVCGKAEELIYPALVAGQKQAIVFALVYATTECLVFFTFGAAFRLGAELLRAGYLSISSLFTLFFVLTFGSSSLGQAITFIPEYFKARLSSSYIFDLIDMQSWVDPYDPSGQKPVMTGKIEFRDVVFIYPLATDVKVLRKVNLTIPARTMVGIVGPPGSGKSSLLLILLRFFEIQSGEVLIDGVNILDINVKHLRDNIGYVAQQPGLFDLSIKENIAYGYHGDLGGEKVRDMVINAAKAADADFIMDELPRQFATRCGENGNHLNPGERNGVAIARAVMNNPPILLLDDPTSMLDAQEEKQVQLAMEGVTKDRTTILISNSYASIRHCEYIGVLAKGRIVEFGKQKELLQKKGIYYRFLLKKGVKL